MLTELGTVLMKLDQFDRSESPKNWNTKLASEDRESALNDAYLAGFFKEADTKISMASADLGVQLGMELLLDVKEAAERR